MARQTQTRSDLIYGFTQGDDTWGNDMNNNLRRMDILGVQPRLNAQSLNSPPSVLPNEPYICTVGSSPTGAFAGWAEHSLAVYDYVSPAFITLGWRNIVPETGWVMALSDTLMIYNATTGWAQIQAGGGGSAESLFRGAWSGSSVSYTAGQIVVFRNEQYMCHSDHTSTTINGPMIGATWRLRWHAISSVDIGEVAAVLAKASIDDDDRLAVQDVSTPTGETKHITIDDLKSDWNASQGSPGFIKNKPDISAARGDFTQAEKTKLAGIGATPAARQSDWDETDDDDETYIKNKPPFVIPDPVTIPGSVVTTTLRLYQRPGVPGRRAGGSVGYLKLTKTGPAAATLPGLIEHMYNGVGTDGLIYGGGVYNLPDNDKWFYVSIGGAGFTQATITECTTTGATIAGTTKHAQHGGGVAGRRAFGTVGNATEGLIVAGWSNNASGQHSYYNDVYYYNRSINNVVTISAVTKTGTAANFASRHRFNMCGDISSGLIWGGVDATRGVYRNDMIAYSFNRATLTITLTTLTKAGVALPGRQEFGFAGSATSATIFGGRAGSYGYQVTNDFKRVSVSSTTATISNLPVWGTAPSRRDAMLMLGNQRQCAIYGGLLGAAAYDCFFVDTSGTQAIVIPLFNSQSLDRPYARLAGYGDANGFYMYGGYHSQQVRARAWHNDFWGTYISNVVYPSYGTAASTPIGARRLHASAGTPTAGVIHGGYNNTSDLSDFWRYSISGELSTTVQLSHSGSTIGTRSAHRMLGSATAGILHGGGSERNGDFHSFTVSGNSITTTKLATTGDQIPNRSFFGMVGSTSLFLIYGGYTSFGHGDARKDVYRVSVSSGTATVTKLTPGGDDMPIRWGHGMVGDANEALVFGGTNFSDAPGILNENYSDFYRITTTATTATVKKLTKSGDAIPAGVRCQMIGTTTAGIIFGMDANIYDYAVTGNDVRISAIRGSAAEMARAQDATVVGTAAAGLVFGGHVNYAVSNRFIKYTTTASSTEEVDTTGTLQAQITAMQRLFQTFLKTVATDSDTGVTGQGTRSSPIRLSNPFTDRDKAALDRLLNVPTSGMGTDLNKADVGLESTLTASGAVSPSIRYKPIMSGTADFGVILGGSNGLIRFNDAYRYAFTAGTGDSPGTITCTQLTRAGVQISGIGEASGVGDGDSGIFFGGYDGSGNEVDKWYSYTVNAQQNTITYAELTKAGVSILGRWGQSMAGTETTGIVGMGYHNTPSVQWFNDFYRYSNASSTVTVTALQSDGHFVDARQDAAMIGSSTAGLITGGHSQYNASGGVGTLEERIVYGDWIKYSVSGDKITFTLLTPRGDVPGSHTGSRLIGDETEGLIIGTRAGTGFSYHYRVVDDAIVFTEATGAPNPWGNTYGMSVAQDSNGLAAMAFGGWNGTVNLNTFYRLSYSATVSTSERAVTFDFLKVVSVTRDQYNLLATPDPKTVYLIRADQTTALPIQLTWTRSIYRYSGNFNNAYRARLGINSEGSTVYICGYNRASAYNLLTRTRGADWTMQSSNTSPRGIVDINGIVYVMQGRTVFAYQPDGTALANRNIAQLESRNTGAEGAAFDDETNRLFVCDSDNHIYVYDYNIGAFTITPRTQDRIVLPWQPYDCHVSHDYLWVVRQNQYVYALPRDGNTFSWPAHVSFRMPFSMYGLTGYGNLLYANSEDYSTNARLLVLRITGEDT